MFVNNMYDLGFDLQDGTKSLAAIIDAFPDFAPKHMLARTRRALQGWSKLEPQQTRPPVPWLLIATLAMTLLTRGKIVAAASILLMFRSLRCAAPRLGASDARNETLLLASAPSSAATTIQSGTQRRNYPARQSSDAMVGGVPAKDSESSHLCPGHHLRQVGEGLEASTTSCGLERAARRPLPVATCRAQLRQAPKPQIASRGEAKRPLGRRQQCPSLRSPCEDQPRVSFATTRAAEAVCGNGSQVPRGGPKVFQDLTKTPKNKRNLVIELFSGCAALSKACAAQGFRALAYDIDYNPGCDLTDPAVFRDLLAFIKDNQSRIAMIWVGTPCSSGSRARKPDGGPRPLRDDGAFLMGFDFLNPTEHQKVLVGNQLMRLSAEVAQLCFALGIPFVIENPLSSRIWLAKPFQQLISLGANFGRTDFCGFKTPWEKSTGFLHWNFEKLTHVFRLCIPSHGRCSFSGRRHVALVGQDEHGVWLTRRAQPYPTAMCAKIAAQLNQS